MKFDPKNPEWDGELFHIKQEACMRPLYTVLANIGFFSKDEVKTCCKINSILGWKAKTDFEEEIKLTYCWFVNLTSKEKHKVIA